MKAKIQVTIGEVKMDEAEARELYEELKKLFDPPKEYISYPVYVEKYWKPHYWERYYEWSTTNGNSKILCSVEK